MDLAGGIRLTYLTWYPPMPPTMNVRLVVDFVDALFEGDGLIADEVPLEPVTYNAGNVATNISDSATA
jgi:hypothetical protein